jgi:hypothetical protein
MRRVTGSVLGLAFVLASPAFAHEAHGVNDAEAKTEAPAPHAFDRFKVLAGEWIAAEDTPSFKKGDLVARSTLTGGDSALVDVLFPGKPYEMTTVYHRDGADLALTHYCAGGNQPRMRASAPAADASVFEFAFDGGTNLDPSRDSHMHSARIQLVSADELIGEWQGWNGGKPDGPPMRFHLYRKK